MTITNTFQSTTNQQHTTSYKTITSQHQNNNHNDPYEDQNDTTQPEQERQCTPGHRDPMVRAARPDGAAAKIHNRHDVDLAMVAGRPLADEPVVRSC